MKMNTTEINLMTVGSLVPSLLRSIACIGLGCLVLNSASPRQGGLSTVGIYPDLTAENLISQDIRSARSVESPSAEQLVLKAFDGNVSYIFDAEHRTLTRATSSKSQKLLSGVDSFSFSLLQPASRTANCELVPASASNAKAVACRWSSSRKLAWAKLDSHEICMSAIFLRNR